jgi:ring-1,2-phenylacetyl-CoA epoxidase subunit PaaD
MPAPIDALPLVPVAPVAPDAPDAPFATAVASPDSVWALLEALTDPEIPVVSLRELGILREVRPAGDGTGGIEVVITPTYSGCPAMGQIEDDVRGLLAAHGIRARVVNQLAPAWTTDWMSDSAREKLLAYGIAPPRCGADAGIGGEVDAATGARVLQFAARSSMAASLSHSVPCPQCRSNNTTETSHFGSTACKSMYRCLDCLEPFDYFKPY